MKKIEFAEGIMLFSSVFRVEIPKETQQAWYALLKGIDGHKFREAISNICKKRTHFFQGENLASLVLDEIHGTVSDQANIAWENVLDLVRKIGQYEIPKFQDRALEATIEAMGGWRKICNWQIDKLEWKRKEFLEIYHSFSRKKKEETGKIEAKKILKKMVYKSKKEDNIEGGAK